MENIDIIKKVVGFTVGVGVTHVLSGIVDNNVQQETGLQRVITFAGKTAITMVVKEIVQDHVDAKIDKAHDWWKINVTEVIDKAEAEAKKTELND